MQAVTREIAFDGGWNRERAAKVTALFDELAGEWSAHDVTSRLEPLADAVTRGGPFPSGVVVELGSGVGLITPWLAERFPAVVAVDLSLEMLRRAPSSAAPLLRADGSALPLRDGEVGALILVNMFLFPAEADRVVRADGAVIWVNTHGDSTPIHLPADDVGAALGPPWHGVASEAYWGTWAVLRRG